MEAIAKLKGHENYISWRSKIQLYLACEGLKSCIEVPATEIDPNKLRMARAILILSCEPSTYVHIQNCRSALDVWETLEKLYKNIGLSQEIKAFRRLISIRMEYGEDMEDYVKKFKNIVSGLICSDTVITDEIKNYSLLTGLNKDYENLILHVGLDQVKKSTDCMGQKMLEIAAISESRQKR